MTEAVVEALSGPARAEDLIRLLIAQWPDAPGLEAVFSLTSAGAALGDLFGSERASENASDLAFRAAALLASDVYTLTCLGVAEPGLRDVDTLSRRIPR